MTNVAALPRLSQSLCEHPRAITTRVLALSELYRNGGGDQQINLGDQKLMEA